MKLLTFVSVSTNLSIHRASSHHPLCTCDKLDYDPVALIPHAVALAHLASASSPLTVDPPSLHPRLLPLPSRRRPGLVNIALLYLLVIGNFPLPPYHILPLKNPSKAGGDVRPQEEELRGTSCCVLARHDIGPDTWRHIPQVMNKLLFGYKGTGVQTQWRAVERVSDLLVLWWHARLRLRNSSSSTTWSTPSRNASGRATPCFLPSIRRRVPGDWRPLRSTCIRREADHQSVDARTSSDSYPLQPRRKDMCPHEVYRYAVRSHVLLTWHSDHSVQSSSPAQGLRMECVHIQTEGVNPSDG